MTGFGRSEQQNGTVTCKVEIRSVNNRFIEINARLPKNLSALEIPIRKLVKGICARGSFDVSISIDKTNGGETDCELIPNLGLAAQYVKAAGQIQNEFGLQGSLDINSLLSVRDIVKFQPLEVDESQSELILQSVESSLRALVQMRETEGKNLHQDVLSRIESVEEILETVKTRQPDILKEYQTRLGEKVKTLNEGVDLDPDRLAQEVAVMADRCDVSEEITRLASHLEQFKILLEKDEPVGRKLEFITQEINREVNTIGSKTSDSQVSSRVIEIKSLLEKIREQLANIE